MEKRSKVLFIISMIIFGTIGIFRRYIPLPSSMLAMARGYIGMLLLLFVLLMKKQKPDISSIRKNLPVLLISGAFIGINWILLFEAYRYTSVAVATLCYYMAPVFVILASPVVLKEKLSAKKILCVVLALIGMALVSGIMNTEITGMSGILLGLGAAGFYASVMLLNKFLKDIHAYDKTIIQLGAAATVLVPYILMVEKYDEISLTPFAVLMVITVGIVHTGIAYALYFGAMTDLSGQTIALFSYIDPIVAIILSAVLLRESMGVFEIAGAVLILAATAWSELTD